jgi:outer membrane protein OmpA-like peptidoglycan-associated protein
MKRGLVLINLMALLTACQSPAGFTPRQIEALKENGFHSSNNNWLLDLDDRLLFPLNSSVVSTSESAVIAHVSKSLNVVGIFGAEIDGYTDSTGTQSYNDALSVRRAEAVKQAMIVAGGMQPDMLEPVGMGARDPVESNDTEEGRAQNRRVVIIVSPADAQPRTGM